MMPYTDDLCPRGIPLEEAARQTENILRTLRDMGYVFPDAAELHLLQAGQIRNGELIHGIESDYVTLRVGFKGLKQEEND